MEDYNLETQVYGHMNFHASCVICKHFQWFSKSTRVMFIPSSILQYVQLHTCNSYYSVVGMYVLCHKQA